MPTTFFCQNLNSDLTTRGSENNFIADTQVSSTGSVVVGGGATDSDAWYTEPAVPNLTTWDAGDYTLQFNITNLDADVTYVFILERVNSSGTLQEELGRHGSAQTATGVVSFTVNKSAITTDVGDRLVGLIEATRGASHGNQSLDYNLDGDSQLIAPFVPDGVTFIPRIIMVS